MQARDRHWVVPPRREKPPAHAGRSRSESAPRGAISVRRNGTTDVWLSGMRPEVDPYLICCRAFFRRLGRSGPHQRATPGTTRLEFSGWKPSRANCSGAASNIPRSVTESRLTHSSSFWCDRSCQSRRTVTAQLTCGMGRTGVNSNRRLGCTWDGTHTLPCPPFPSFAGTP